MARDDTAVLNPNLGVYFNLAPLAIPKRGLRDCLNVRIKEGRIVRDNVGYGAFPDDTNAINLDNKPVTLIDNFFPRDGGQFLILGNTTDLFQYDEANTKVTYLTPRYETGTVDVTNGSTTVTGSGTSWNANLKAGDFIHVGATGQTELTATWYEIASVDSDTQVTLTSAYQEATASGQAYTARQVFTGQIDDYWETATFMSAANVGGDGGAGDRMYFTNGTDAVVAWDAVDDQVYTPSLGNIDTVGALAVFKNIMFYVNITVNGDKRPFSVRSSAIGEPENVATGESAENVVHDGVDPLVAAFSLGENLVLYGERTITLSQFVGGSVLFAFRTVISGLGPLAGRAIGDFGDFHEFLGPDAQYRFDGISITEIGAHVWREIIRQQSPQRLDMINSHFDEENGELVWIMPLTTDPDPTNGGPRKAFIEHYLEIVDQGEPTPYTIRELPATATGFFSRENTLTWNEISEDWSSQNYRFNDRFFQAAFPFNLFGDENGNIFIMGTKDTKDGTVMQSFARFGRRPLGDVERKGVLQRVYPFVETLPGASHDLDVVVFTANEPGGDANLAETLGYDLTQSTSRHFVSPRESARYVEVQFGTEGAGHIWTLQGYDMKVAPGGRR